MEEINCLVCKNKAQILPFGGYQYQDKIYSLYGCSFCKLRFIWPQPTSEELASTYNDLSYWQSGDFAGDKTNCELYRKQYRKDAQKIIKIAKRFNILPEKFLEIGCAQGDLLLELKSYFKSVIGVDISELMIELAKKKGLEVYAGEIEKINLPSDFTCVYLGDLVEHLPDPVSFFGHLKKIIKDKSLVIIEIPLTYNVYPANLFLAPLISLKNFLKGKTFKPRSLYFFSKTQREKNKKIEHPPYHLLEFTPRSARAFFNLISWQVVYDKVYVGWPKRKYYKLKNWHLLGLQIIFSFITKYAPLFDLGDRMTIVIRPIKK